MRTTPSHGRDGTPLAYDGAGSSPVSTSLAASFESFARAAGVLVVLAGCLVLVGWTLDVGVLKSVAPGLSSMKANTAFTFVLAGAALRLWLAEPSDRRSRLAVRALALAVTAIGLLTMAEYAFGWNLGIDQLLFIDTESSPPGRMAPATTLGFVLIGPALLCLTLEHRRVRVFSQGLAALSGTIGVLALIGYLYGVPSLYEFAPYVSTALHTAALLLLISSGILAAQPNLGLMGAVSSDDAGGYLARRLLPVVLGFPILIGWLALAGERAGLYDATLKTVYVVVSHVLVLTASVLLSARSLHLAENRRRRAEEQLVEAREESLRVLARKDRSIRQAYTDVIDAVTGGKLLLMTPDEIEAALGEPVEGEHVVSSGDLGSAIDRLQATVPREFPALTDITLLVDSAGEALTNAVKHAGGGTYQLYRKDGYAQLRVTDNGPGIDFANLPKSTLTVGYSTVGTLGRGFDVMLRRCDRVLLSTQPGNTTIVLEVKG